MTDMTFVKHKRNNPTCDPRDSQGNGKMQFLFLLLLALIFRSEMKTSLRGTQNKKPFEMILYVGRVRHTFEIGREVRN